MDISDLHGTELDERMRSVWMVVDAMHATPQSDTNFSQTHIEQLNVAKGFQKRYQINADNYLGAIDGILVCIHKPTMVDVKNEIKFGPIKFFCG